MFNDNKPIFSSEKSSLTLVNYRTKSKTLALRNISKIEIDGFIIVLMQHRYTTAQTEQEVLDILSS